MKQKKHGNLISYFKNSSRKGSITVEASMGVPLFFLLIFSLLYLFPVLEEQLLIQKELVLAAKNYESYEVEQPILCLKNGSVWYLQWNINEEYGVCECHWNRSVPMIGDWFSTRATQRVPVRKYTGVSMLSDETEEGDYVYVAENGTVYHRKVTCTYLYLGIQEISTEKLQSMRNRSGGIYKPCEICMKNVSLAEKTNILVTPYGDRYHNTRDCSGLRRTVQKVKKSQIGNLPPCSKCGKE